MQLKAQDGNVLISGSLAKDAEYKRVGESGIDLTTFSLAVGSRDNGGEKKETIWVNVNCWRAVAPQAASLKKGDSALVIGKPGSRTYKGNDGVERVSKFVNAEMVIPVPKVTYLPPLDPDPPQQPYAPASSTPNAGDDEYGYNDLPF